MLILLHDLAWNPYRIVFGLCLTPCADDFSVYAMVRFMRTLLLRDSVTMKQGKMISMGT